MDHAAFWSSGVVLKKGRRATLFVQYNYQKEIDKIENSY